MKEMVGKLTQMIDNTLLLTKRDGHWNVGDQFNLFLALLGVLSWSRLVAPLRPSNIFHLIVRGRLHQFHVVPPVKIDWKKLEGPRGPTLINQHRTPRSTRKRWNWSPTFQCPSLFVRSSVVDEENPWFLLLCYFVARDTKTISFSSQQWR